ANPASLAQRPRRAPSLCHRTRGAKPGTHCPLCRIDEHGLPHALGALTALHGDGRLVTTASAPDWPLGKLGDGLFPGMPRFLDHQRPQGSLGCQLGPRCARHGHPGARTELVTREDGHAWNPPASIASARMTGAAWSRWLLGATP